VTCELFDTRKYGPYVRVSKMHPYVRDVHTARTYGPYVRVVRIGPQRPILSFFAQQGRHVAPMRVKFGTKRGPKLFSSVPNFTLTGATIRVQNPQKLKFLLRFDQNVEYKRPAGAYPLRDFYKICRVCTSFHDALAVQISWDLLKEL